MTHLWFLLTFFFILLELLNPGLFYFLSLALGAGLTFLSSINHLGYPYSSIMYQYMIFFIGSLISLFFLNIYARKSQKHKNSKAYLSNMYQLIGKTIEIISVDNDLGQSGYGKVNNEIWPIKLQIQNTLKTQQLKVGTFATIVGVQGCHLQIIILAQN